MNKLIFFLPFSLLVLSSHYGFSASYNDTIVKTTVNADGPANQAIDIKDVDLHRIDFGYESTNITSYYLSVYLWSRTDLGEESGSISLFDVNDLSLRPISATGDPSKVAEKVGFDSSTGYFVYLIKMPVDTRDASQTSALYASITESGNPHYSNEEVRATILSLLLRLFLLRRSKTPNCLHNVFP